MVCVGPGIELVIVLQLINHSKCSLYILVVCVCVCIFCGLACDVFAMGNFFSGKICNVVAHTNSIIIVSDDDHSDNDVGLYTK